MTDGSGDLSILWPALLAGVLTMLATGLGALPVLFRSAVPERFLGGGYALAGGMMAAVSFFDLVLPGLERGDTWKLALGFTAGGLVFGWAARRISDKEWTVAGLRGASGRRVLLILGTMFIHSFPEGVAIGVGYGSGEVELGLFIAIAIAIHNVPEGLAISLPLAAEGVGFWRCFGYSVLSSLPQPIAVIPSVLLVWFFAPLLPIGLGFAAGAMIYLVIAELLPESFASAGKHLTAGSFIIGFVMMMLLQYAL